MTNRNGLIEVLLDETLAKLQGFDQLDRRWFAEVMFDDLGCVYGIGEEEHPVRAIRDGREAYVEAVAAAVRQDPEQAGHAYKAAHADARGARYGENPAGDGGRIMVSYARRRGSPRCPDRATAGRYD